MEKQFLLSSQVDRSVSSGSSVHSVREREKEKLREIVRKRWRENQRRRRELTRARFSLGRREVDSRVWICKYLYTGDEGGTGYIQGKMEYVKVRSLPCGLP